MKKLVAEALYCGIDVGMKSHAVCLLDGSCNVIGRYSIGNDRSGFSRLKSDLCKDTKLCLEPTGVYSVNIFIFFKRAGFNIRFCETRSSKHFRDSMFEKKKHDRLDCVALAKYRLVNEEKTFDGDKILNNLAYDSDDVFYSRLRALLQMFRSVSKEHTKVKNRIKTLVDLRFPEAVKLFPYNRGCKTVLTVLSSSRDDVLSGNVRLRYKHDEICKELKDSIGQFDLKSKEFKLLVEESVLFDKRLSEIRAELKDELCSKGYGRLFGYCGLNAVNIASFVSEIQDIGRFSRFNADGSFSKKRSLKAFKNFIGLAVTSNQSGQKEGGHKLVKAGNKVLRNILLMMSLTYISMKKTKKSENTEAEGIFPSRYSELYEGYTKKTKKMIAVTKVMGKVATDLFFVLRDVSRSNQP